MKHHEDDLPEAARLPARRVAKLTEPVARFLKVEAASGLVLLLATCAAVALANSPWSAHYLALWKVPLGIRWGTFSFEHSLKHWINDALMTIFFFVIGLEVKRELVLGHLREFRAAILPVVAAVGGMVVPAALFLALQAGQAGERGWGIPMATDIAFVVGCLAVLGSRIPAGLRILLLTLAIVDDIGAILVIAVGYASNLSFVFLGYGAAGLVLISIFARLGVRSIPVYTVLGAAVWFAFHESGVHATIAGVILGLLTPAHRWISPPHLQAIVQSIGGFLQGDDPERPPPGRTALRSMEIAARESLSPLERLETLLHPYVGFVIMPLFAFANAGVPLVMSDFRQPVAIAVFVGLVLGKPLGIVGFSWLAVRTGLAQLPTGVTWKIVAGGGILAGIGFTMALFIAGLALQEPLLGPAKVGILAASTLCATVGTALLFLLTANDAVREGAVQAPGR